MYKFNVINKQRFKSAVAAFRILVIIIVFTAIFVIIMVTIAHVQGMSSDSDFALANIRIINHGPKQNERQQPNNTRNIENGATPLVNSTPTSMDASIAAPAATPTLIEILPTPTLLAIKPTISLVPSETSEVLPTSTPVVDTQLTETALLAATAISTSLAIMGEVRATSTSRPTYTSTPMVTPTAGRATEQTAPERTPLVMSTATHTMQPTTLPTSRPTTIVQPTPSSEAIHLPGIQLLFPEPGTTTSESRYLFGWAVDSFDGELPVGYCYSIAFQENWPGGSIVELTGPNYRRNSINIHLSAYAHLIRPNVEYKWTIWIMRCETTTVVKKAQESRIFIYHGDNK